jgi:hypothetical protein
MMAKLSGGKVISFDNDPAEIEHMRDVFSQNPELQIQVVQTFVGTTDGDGYMSIDRASREFFPPNFIKLDIEGGEDMALEGARETLAVHRPKLIIEVHGEDKEKRCASILRGAGYSITTINQSWFWHDRARTGFNHWLAADPV